MRWPRRTLLILATLLLLAATPIAWYYYFGYYKPLHIRQAQNTARLTEQRRLAQKAAGLRSYMAHRPRQFNEDQAFLIDMQLASGKSRFFVYDLKKDSIRLAGLVAHGSCNLSFSASPSFSNVSGSGCSSLGRYRIGGPSQGHFGTAYKLYGIDSSNSQAFARDVVLHSYQCVPAGETDPLPICNSKGCAMVAPSFMQQLYPILEASKKPMLLWIFD